MEKSFKVIDDAASVCGSCQSSNCEECSTTVRKETSSGMSRREPARMTFAGSAAALAGSEENARGHIIVTARTGGPGGVLPAIVKGLKDYRKVTPRQLREAYPAAAPVGYLCKHSATLSAAEGGCQTEIGVGSAMAAKDMNPRYKETSEAGLAALVLC